MRKEATVCPIGIATHAQVRSAEEADIEDAVRQDLRRQCTHDPFREANAVKYDGHAGNCRTEGEAY